MAIDFDAIRRKLNKLSGQNSRQNTSWRPQEGEEHTVRLLSFPDNDGQPFKELWFYYNIGNNPGLLAPYQFGNPDPIQELITKLRDDGSKESYELAKKLYPKMRCYAPVVVRGEEDKGVRIWAFGKTVYQSLLNIMLDEDYGDITNLTEGWDFKVVKDTQGQWPNYDKSAPKPKQSSAGSDKQIAEWMDELHDIHGLVKLPEYDELKNLAMEMEGLVTGRPTGNVSEAARQEEEGDEDYIAHLKSLKSN